MQQMSMHVLALCPLTCLLLTCWCLYAQCHVLSPSPGRQGSSARVQGNSAQQTKVSSM